MAENGRWLKTKTAMKTFILLFFSLCIQTVIVFSQPPDLLSNPAQAPIDGGLAFVAAAGGAYAWRKLKSPKK
jgi:hypothetical protein